MGSPVLNIFRERYIIKIYYNYNDGSQYTNRYINYDTATGLYSMTNTAVGVSSTSNGLSPGDLLLLTLYYPEPPSNAPTTSPTDSPTVIPTVVPSEAPTIIPTVIPSEAPTVNPTVTPSFSFVPSAVPTVVPSEVPTVAPSTSPTMIPTTNPTVIPSVIPTVIPAASPSMIPTTNPSVIPTIKNPTVTPTTVPTQIPTIVHTISPASVSVAKVDCSAKAERIVTIVPFGGIYTSVDRGQTWTNIHPVSVDLVAVSMDTKGEVSYLY